MGRWCATCVSSTTKLAGDFINTGDIFAFEEGARYRKRKISERMDRELIDAYSRACGFPLSSVCQYSREAYVFRRTMR